MQLQPHILSIVEKKLAGKRLIMSLANNQTFKLWQSFMPLRNTIKNKLNNELISMQIYPASFDFSFANPEAEFEKWATVEVMDFANLAENMETYIMPGGLYAVFNYKGLSNDSNIFRYIYGSWLPKSAYTLDNRPHFEILGDKYKNNDPDSEEEIWIPLKPKG